MREKLRKLMAKDGFYIILFICVCIVAVTSVWISRSNLNKLESQDEPIKEEDFIVVEDDGENNEPSLEISKMEGGKLEEREDEEREDEEISEAEKENNVVDEEEEIEEDKKEDKEEKKVPTTETVETFAMPVQGEIINDFTNENLVYSKTLEEWTSHGGIDVEGKVGTTVKAFADGTVTEVYEDELWGIVIVIDHGNNLISKYANLSTKEMVKVGLNVKKGDPISGIGNPKGIELNEVPHLHFEVISNGKNVDPKEYLSGY